MAARKSPNRPVSAPPVWARAFSARAAAIWRWISSTCRACSAPLPKSPNNLSGSTCAALVADRRLLIAWFSEVTASSSSFTLSVPIPKAANSGTATAAAVPRATPSNPKPDRSCGSCCARAREADVPPATCTAKSWTWKPTFCSACPPPRAPVLMAPKLFCASDPMDWNSAFSWPAPSALILTDTCFSAISLGFPVVGLDQLRFQRGHELVDQRRRKACGAGHGQDGRHVEPDQRPGNGAHLATRPKEQVPDRPSLMGLRFVQCVGALGAGAVAPSAIVCAPAEVPLGAGDDPFFSASSVRRGTT